MSLSAVINTKNSAETLKSCLKSLQFVQEIVIVDMHSSDDTIKIAKKFTDLIYSYKDVGYVEPARNYAISKAKNDWILIVDADEEIPTELANEIQEIMSRNEYTAVAIPRKNMVFGGWLQHAGWWPDYQLRLFRKGSVEWSDKIHKVPTVSGNINKLLPQEKLAILHHNYPNVEMFIERLNRYTSKEVESRGYADIHPSTLVGGFRTELMSRLFVHEGISGGTRGVGIAFLQASYELLVRLKQWESQQYPNTKEKPIETLREIKAFQQDLAYWIANWHVKNTSGFNKLLWMMRRKLKI